jgi:hypothetical protein
MDDLGCRYDQTAMRHDFLEWLKKLARWCKAAGAAFSALGTCIETLVVMLGGPGFGAV